MRLPAPVASGSVRVRGLELAQVPERVSALDLDLAMERVSGLAGILLYCLFQWPEMLSRTLNHLRRRLRARWQQSELRQSA
jgi:hypothetical protein